jgi:hypothetical protein
VIVAASLAAGCWITYGVLVHTQFLESREAAAKISAFADAKKAIATDDEKRISIIKDANTVVNQTASSIYTIIGPIATAITGYFFLASGSKKNSDSDEKLPPSDASSGETSSTQNTKTDTLDAEGNTIGQ